MADVAGIGGSASRKPGPAFESPAPISVEAALQEAVRGVLRERYGERVANALEHNVKPADVAREPHEVLARYHRLLGPRATGLEWSFLEQLYGRLGLPWVRVARVEFCWAPS
jgi:hypothetical protein